MFSFFYEEPNLPRPCACGDTAHEYCPEVGLSNHRHFPPFAYLPDYNDADESYYHCPDGSFSYTPSRHWVFVGEIIENRSDFIRPRALVESKFGERVLVNFHLEDSPTPAFFQWSDLQPGYTMCLLYPTNKEFMDTSRGIRQEYSKSSMVFPVKLDKLANHCKSIVDETLCFACGKSPDTGIKFKQCSKCHLACYCSRECQANHWKIAGGSHKKLCPHMKKLSMLMALDFESFRGFLDWNFHPEPPLSPTQRRERDENVIHDFFRSRGVEPLSMPERLQAILSSVEDKDLSTNPVSRRLFDALCTGMFRVMAERQRPDLLSGTFSSSYLCRGLQELAGGLASSSNNQTAVVDMMMSTSNEDTTRNYSTTNRGMEETFNNILMSTLLFALPQWQHELGVTKVIWVAEVHHYFPGLSLFSSEHGWNVKSEDQDGFVAEHRASNDYCFFHDELPVLASVADHVAQTFPESLVIRIFRAYATPFRTDVVQHVACSPTAENVVTLWIREDGMLGRFRRPQNSELSLEELLVDFDGDNNIFVDMMRMGPRNEEKEQDEDNNEEDEWTQYGL